MQSLPFCRENEILINNKTGCQRCPESFWPDDATATTCEKIPAVYLKTSDTSAIVLLVLAACLVVMYVFYRNRNVKLVKASSRELTGIILIGIILAYLVVFSYIAKPSKVSCYCSHLGFNLAVTLIYSPLLLKTNRVYRIFTGNCHTSINYLLV